MLYILCFFIVPWGLFLPSNSGVFGVVFLHFLPFFCRRCSVTFVAEQRGGCLHVLPTPPLYRRSRNKSNPKKNFFIFFNIDILLIFFLHFGTLLWWIDVLRCGVMFVMLELRGVLGVLWDFCILGDIIYRFDKQTVLKRLKIGFLR